MSKQIVNFIELTELYNILNEIKNFLSFDLKNYKNKDVFFKDLDKNSADKESLIVTNQ